MKRLLLFTLFLIIAFQVSGLEMIQGKIKLVLHEKMGRFSLFCKTDTKKEYTSFFVDSDPRTSSLLLLIDNKVHRLGDTSFFKEEIEKTTTGARFVWTSKVVVVIEEFMFVQSADSPVVDGIKINISIQNISSEKLEIGARIIFDTYLGEPANIHFTAPEMEKFIKEKIYRDFEIPAYWISPGRVEDGLSGLQVMTGTESVTIPNSIVFANWKRLNDASWFYEPSGALNFNLLPYSVNDSAVCQYYDAQPVLQGSNRTITLLMGVANSQGFSSAKVSEYKKPVEATPKDSESTSSATTPYQLEQDIAALDNLIKEIDKLLASGKVSEQQLQIIERILNDIKVRY